MLAALAERQQAKQQRQQDGQRDGANSPRLDADVTQVVLFFGSDEQGVQCSKIQHGCNLSAHVSVASHDVGSCCHLGQPHGSASVQFLGGDADLGAESELAAVGESGRSVDHDGS